MSEEAQPKDIQPVDKHRDPGYVERRRAYVEGLRDFRYAIQVLSPAPDSRYYPGQEIVCSGVAANKTAWDWKSVIEEVDCLRVAVEVYSLKSGAHVHTATFPMPEDALLAGQSHPFRLVLPAGKLEPGRYKIRFDLQYIYVCRFSEKARQTPPSFELEILPEPANDVVLKQILGQQKVQSQISLDQEIRALREEERQRDPESLLLRGYKAYAQCDEDGIIEEIFRRIGTTNKICCEFGVENGLENNTHYLLLKGWRGIWIEADAGKVDRLRREVGHCSGPELSVQQAFIRRENINDLIRAGLAELGETGAEPVSIDFLSIDIDGNDLYVLHDLDVVQPRVICAEYTALFRPPTAVSIPYGPDYVWEFDDYQGASLAAFVDLLEARGYALVTCNLAGVNAFFVLESELKNIDVRPVEELYRPPRYHLIGHRGGHPPSLKYLADRVRRPHDAPAIRLEGAEGRP